MSLKLGTTSIPGIRVVAEGGSSPTPTPIEKGVIFIDYDGTIIEQWVTDSVANKSALPDNPSHNGLTAQGWNWSLVDIKSYITNTSNALLIVGQLYTTVSGATEFDIEINGATTSPYLELAPYGTVVIDWGDNSSTSTMTGTSLTTTKRTQHVYASSGKYTIKATVSSGTCAFKGTKYTTLLSQGNTSTVGLNRFYSSSVKAIRMGPGMTTLGGYGLNYCTELKYITISNAVTTLDSYAFNYCTSISTIILPNTITSIGGRGFYDCFSLTRISLPISITNIDQYAFYECYSLKSLSIPNSSIQINSYAFYHCREITSVTLPNTVAKIGQYAFCDCNSIVSVTMPSGVTDIESYAFNNCQGLREVVFPNTVTSIADRAFASCFALYKITMLGTTVPTIGSVTFDGVNFSGGARIYVPSASLSEYQSATNWSAYASYMVGE